MSNHDNSLFENERVVDSDRIIYTPSDFAKTSLLHLQEVGQLKARKQHTSSRKNLNSYLFFIVDEGGGTVEYDGETYRLERNDCVFFDCKRNYSHSTGESLWKLHWVHFYGPNMSAIYGKYISRGGKACFQAKNGNEYRSVVEKIHTIAASSGHVKDMKIHEKLSSLLVLLMEESGYEIERAATGKSAQLQNVKEYIDAHYTEKITLDELSERFYINKFYLLEIFKREYGMGVNQYLIHLRITKSKGLLRFTDKTAEEIAYECGMNSPNYFNRVFKKIEGITPGEYRKMWVK